MPAWGAMVRINPSTRNGFVLLISGGSGTVNQLIHDWVYWETGKVTPEGKRQVVSDRLLRGHTSVVIILGAIFIGGLQLLRARFGHSRL